MGLSASRLRTFYPEGRASSTHWVEGCATTREGMDVLGNNIRSEYEGNRPTEEDRQNSCTMTPCHPSCTYRNCINAGRNLAHRQQYAFFPHPHTRGTWLNAMWKHGNTVTWAQCHRHGANDIALKTRAQMRKVGSSANNIYEYFTNQPTDWRQKVRLDNELPNRITLRFADKMAGALVTSKTLW
jgi:hypothetical protein